ncbi:YheU family protein [Simiduia sp. 21SJ11W-1]|uniref:YheU family protein n=1 Tax=Simiduia sp. 21SJ11W-1 TaxID=2909669 RepID=UPI0020A2089B|nr:YheU family protein [Simiduia sp. 21SJ11W-1]UTA46573.1 YheU family protein [Simiduia sp. 21SJ11W-1]
MIVIAPEQLPADTLDALLEEFATRDGTDYGEQEVDLASKVASLKLQLQRKQVLIVFDLGAEQANLMTKEDYQQRLAELKAAGGED